MLVSCVIVNTICPKICSQYIADQKILVHKSMTLNKKPKPLKNSEQDYDACCLIKLSAEPASNHSIWEAL